MVAERFPLESPDSPITNQPNWTTQPRSQTSRVEIDTMRQVWDEGVQCGRLELVKQIEAIIDGCWDGIVLEDTSVIELVALNEIIALLDKQCGKAVQG